MARQRHDPSGVTAAEHGRLEALAVTALAALAAIAVAAAVNGAALSSRGQTRAVRAAHGIAGLERLPAGARVPVSRALGSADAGYWAVRHGGALSVRNPAQGLVAGFSPAGIAVSVGSGRVTLSLYGLGYGRRLAPVGAAPPIAAGNRVVYARRGVAEWYVNGPLGIDQGFTIAAPPAGAATGRLTLALHVGGSLHARPGRAGAVAFVSSDGRSLIDNDDLRVTDARGRQLQASLLVRHRTLRIEVAAVGARYPLTIDPLIHAATLTGGGETGPGQFGWSVALSADGSTALVGGPQDDSYAGAAWVFTRLGATWSQQGSKLTGATAGSEGSFGSSVALSADGTTALVGAVEDNLASGAVVFTRSAAGWSQQAVLASGSPGSGGSVDGFSTTLSGDGNTALIGGNGNNLGGDIWVFSRSGSTWSQQGGTLTGSGEVGPAQFGLSGIALSTNGNIALIGAPDTLAGSTPAVGSAWVFTRSRSKWVRDRSGLTGGSSEGLGFGASVALSSTGQVALIGATSEEVASTGIGSARVFVSPPNTTITSTSVNHTNRSARFTFTATGLATGFQCALVRRPSRPHGPTPFSSCRSPKAYRHLEPGRYAFLVRALDGSVADPTPATKTVEIG